MPGTSLLFTIRLMLFLVLASAIGLTAIRLVVPPRSIVQAFDRLVSPVLEKIEANDEEARTLAGLRDFLLPKLLSGEIGMKDAEALAGSIP